MMGKEGEGDFFDNFKASWKPGIDFFSSENVGYVHLKTEWFG